MEDQAPYNAPATAAPADARQARERRALALRAAVQAAALPIADTFNPEAFDLFVSKTSIYAARVHRSFEDLTLREVAECAKEAMKEFADRLAERLEKQAPSAGR